MTFIWGQFHMRNLSHQSLKLAEKLHIIQISFKSPRANKLKLFTHNNNKTPTYGWYRSSTISQVQKGLFWQSKAWTKWPIFCIQHFQMQFLGKKFIFIKISLMFVPLCSINNKPIFFQVMALHQTDGKPLPMITHSHWRICVTRPQ